MDFDYKFIEEKSFLIITVGMGTGARQCMVWVVWVWLKHWSSSTGENGASLNTYVPYLEAQQQNMVSGLYGKGKAMLGWDAGFHGV